MSHRTQRVRLRDLFAPPRGLPEEARPRPGLDQDDLFEDLLEQEIDLESLAADLHRSHLKCWELAVREFVSASGDEREALSEHERTTMSGRQNTRARNVRKSGQRILQQYRSAAPQRNRKSR